MKSIKINFSVFISVWVAMAVLLAVALNYMEIDTDVTKYLPQNDPVISDAEHVFKNHPIHDRVVIDIGLKKEDVALLLACSRFLEQKLTKSGMFKQVGLKDFQEVMPEIMGHVLNNLPTMFDEQDLNEKVAPLLTFENINRKIRNNYNHLLNLDGIGRSTTISKDPLALAHIVLARLSSLAPSKEIRFNGGQLISSDGKHLLLIATPFGSGTDTALARKLASLFSTISLEVTEKFGHPKNPIDITPMGAYRAALDNEIISKKDSERAIFMASIGIALLLVFAFPRPLLGLFAFLPALAGSVAALFVMALWDRSISIMALGFGGAIIAITVDHGIAFLLFLDRPRPTGGRAAAREIWSVGLVAALTTMGAFGALTFCDFPIFQQLGRFTALGIAFSFLFVHLVFPLIFPSMPPASPRTLPLRKGVIKLTGLGKKGALGAVVFAVIMAFYARPEFLVSLHAMNTVSEETLADERTFTHVWGKGIFENISLMVEGKDVARLQIAGDNMLPMFYQDLHSKVLSSGFLPSMVFPGEKRARGNLSAWRSFWHPERVARLKSDLREASESLGFRSVAFAPFFEILANHGDTILSTDIPPKFYDMLSITRKAGTSAWVQFSNLKPGSAYDPQAFYERYGVYGKIFDPGFFSKRLGGLLFSTFLNMLWIIGLSVILLLFLFFLDWRLVLISLVPVLFALVCTLGTLNLMDHPLDIPGLMLSIVVVGMGIDYSLFWVRAYQRYGNEDDPSFQLIKMTIFMASCSTIIGFGVLCFAEHALLRSAGLTSLLGITYSLAGAFVILPPLIKFVLRNPKKKAGKLYSPRQAILRRYRNIEAYPRCFARFKMMTDPMFKELPGIFAANFNLKTIMDIGMGYGVPACWLLERFPEATVYGIDPDGERVRVASMVVGKRGLVKQGAAPGVPAVPMQADAAVMLDMIHYLTDDALALTLKRLHMNLGHGGRLVIRAAVLSGGNRSLLWKVEAVKSRLFKIPLYYRSIDKILEALEKAGFQVELQAPSGSKGESIWVMAERR